MTGIVCLDQEDGLLFNGRRQSRDRVVTEKILSMTEGKPLWMSAYSRRIFPEDAPVCVAEDLVGKLAEPARKDVEQVESAQEELEREKAAQKESGQQSGEATFCLIEEAVNLGTEISMMDRFSMETRLSGGCFSEISGGWLGEGADRNLCRLFP